MKCPNCQKPGQNFVMVCRPGGVQERLCWVCNGTNEIDDERGRRMAIGRRLRDKRVRRQRSLREVAPELGVLPSVLSHIEQGHLETPEHYELWNRLTGEKLGDGAE